jgi:transposase-like protein
VGRLIALLTEEPVSAQTVSQVTRDLDQAVAQFHRAPLGATWRYLFLDGVSLRVRRPGGRKRVQLLVAYGIRPNGTRQLLAFTRSQGESQVAWESLLQDLYRRGLQGDQLHLIVTDGCVGLASALQTVYPRVAHQRCWVHKLRNLLAPVRRRDHAAVKVDLQAIYQATHRREAEAAARQFARQWQATYPKVVASLLKDLPELLAFFSCPRRLWRRLRTTNIIERCFVEVRRRTRPMVCFVNVQSVERIIYSIFNRFNLEWSQHALRAFTQAA